jgi:hypothetical protein
MICKQFLVLISLALSMMANGVAYDDDLPSAHYEDPDEIDVVNPPVLCYTNADGFGGDLTNDFLTVSYHYELQYLTEGSSLEDIIASVEKDSSDFLLQSPLFDLPCSTSRSRSGGRRSLNAVGITANPGDEVLEGVECSTLESTGDSSIDCVTISAAFNVYYNEETDDIEQLAETFLNSVTTGINGGSVEFKNPNVVKVAAVDNPSGTPTQNIGDSANTDGINSGATDATSTTPIIIGATVGAVLILGGVALYRKRQSGAEGETTFTPEPKPFTDELKQPVEV